MEKKDIMKSFLDELKVNKELAKQFLAQKDSVQGAYNVAKPYLSGMSKDEFSRELEILGKKALESGELSPEALEAVSGGISDLAVVGVGLGAMAILGGTALALEVNDFNKKSKQGKKNLKKLGIKI